MKTLFKIQFLGLLSATLTAGLLSCTPSNQDLRAENTSADVVGATESKPTPPPPPPPRYPKPEYVRGIYLTAWSAGSQRKRDNIAVFIKDTELNSVVIDIRDAGEVYWETGIELVEESGALKLAVVKPEDTMQWLDDNDIYPIARIACFRDNFVTDKYPERAVQKTDGTPWKDRAGYRWLDPYNKDNWEYLGQIVDFALELGFPEIQLDYVRFPSEGKVSSMVFPGKDSYDDPDAKPEDVITAFADFIAGKVHAKKAVYSADIFGIISSTKDDQGIGQSLEKVAEPFDLICPMVYPSHFAPGEYKVKDPNKQPYEIVFKSLSDFKERLPNKPLRPWLQDFSWPVKYGKKEIQAQIKAAKVVGYEEYLIWNASNRYTEEAYVDNSKLVEDKDKKKEEVSARESDEKEASASQAQKAKDPQETTPENDSPDQPNVQEEPPRGSALSLDH